MRLLRGLTEVGLPLADYVQYARNFFRNSHVTEDNLYPFSHYVNEIL